MVESFRAESLGGNGQNYACVQDSSVQSMCNLAPDGVWLGQDKIAWAKSGI